MIDKIEREIVLPVSRERVWDAITTAEQLGAWFAKQVDLDFKVGGEILFHWQDGQKTRGIIQRIEPVQLFSFRWDFKNTDLGDPLFEGNSTIVTFQLDQLQDSTRLKVSEEGFASLPERVRHSIYQENDHGWQVELDEMKDFLVSELP
jgi:uncharacterized protein YndB with AHSA1/START domain